MHREENFFSRPHPTGHVAPVAHTAAVYEVHGGCARHARRRTTRRCRRGRTVRRHGEGARRRGRGLGGQQRDGVGHATRRRGHEPHAYPFLACSLRSRPRCKGRLAYMARGGLPLVSKVEATTAALAGRRGGSRERGTWHRGGREEAGRDRSEEAGCHWDEMRRAARRLGRGRAASTVGEVAWGGRTTARARAQRAATR